MEDGSRGQGGAGNGEVLVEGYKVGAMQNESVQSLYARGDYSQQHCTAYQKLAKRANFRCSQHTMRKKKVTI